MLANGWRWRWDSDFQNKHGEWVPVNKRLRAHPRSPMCYDLDLPQKRCFDWPTKISDGLQNTLDAEGESCQSTEVCIIYSLIYSIQSERRTPLAMTSFQLMSSPFKVFTETERLVSVDTKVEGRAFFQSSDG